MKGFAAIGDNNVFYIIPEKLLNEIKTKETDTSIQYQGAVYVVYSVVEKNDIKKLREYEKHYILDHVLN